MRGRVRVDARRARTRRTMRTKHGARFPHSIPRNRLPRRQASQDKSSGGVDVARQDMHDTICRPMRASYVQTSSPFPVSTGPLPSAEAQDSRRIPISHIPSVHLLWPKQPTPGAFKENLGTLGKPPTILITLLPPKQP